MNLRTDRLHLRPFTGEDAPFALALLNEPSFLRWIGDKGVRDLEGARAYLQGGPLASYARHGHGLLAVDRLDSGATLGMCGLLKRDHLEAPDLGYAFLPAAWGQGFAFEAARAVVDHGHRDLGLRRILALVTPGNAPSIRLLERLAFRSEGLIRLPGEDEGVACFAWAPPGA